MSAEWIRLARDCRLAVDENGRIDVACGDNRSHRVRVDSEDPDFLRIWSVVMTRASLNNVELNHVTLWEQNRYRELVGFKVDERGKLIGEAWLPRVGSTSEEFGFVVGVVAKACDQMEYVLTGRDVE